MRILAILTLLIALPVFAAEENAGFVQGLWYSSDTFFADQPTRIYAAIRNNTGSDITGTIEFFDGNKLLERTDVSALNGRLIESWADWTPEYGEHELRAELKRVVVDDLETGHKTITVETAVAEDTVFVDYDTDDDGVGNENDEDDDGDGIKDEDDPEPLIYDEPDEPASETGSDNESGTETNTAAESNANDSTDQTNGPEGLEQFLVESRADNALSSVTSVVNNTRERLDTYRERRQIDRSEAESELVIETESNLSTSTASSSTPTDRIGDITRSQTDQGPGIVSSIVSAIGTALERAYTFILFLISSYLAHPALVQVTLLILILYIIFKLARRLSSRPQ